MRTALSIAGSDCSGGAGIQADLKTFAAHHVYGMSAITALTAQNTLGVQAIHEAPPEFVAQELDSIFDDIRPDAVKIGMVSSAALIATIAERLRFHKGMNIVLDPVMVSTSGSRLLAADAQKVLEDELMPLALLITPNIPEAEALTGMTIGRAEDMVAAGRLLAQRFEAGILVKGGHSVNDANDLLVYDGREIWFDGKRIDTKNTHGTGCTLSSAIAANLALGVELPKAISNAKEYLSEVLRHDPCLGHGNGPLDHAAIKPPELHRALVESAEQAPRHYS